MKILSIAPTGYVSFSSNKTKPTSKQNKKDDIEKAKSFQSAARNLDSNDKSSIKAINTKMLACLNSHFDDENQLAIEVLHLEDMETIIRFAQLKNSSFRRTLTDDEALLLSRPYSIKYADITEAQDEIYLVDDKFKFEIEIAKKTKTRRFDDKDIKIFIDTKDRSNDFTSANQIMRFIELMKDENGFSRKLNAEEARYFARKCANFDEIQSFLDYIEKSYELKTIYNQISKKPYRITYRTIQTDNTKELKLYTRNKDFHIVYTFVNGKLTSLIKNNKKNQNHVETWDAIKRTTSIIKLGLKPCKNAQAEYPREIIEILNDYTGQPNKIIRTYLDENDIVANSSTYNLSQYNETLDVLKGIESDSIQSSYNTTSKLVLNDKICTVSQAFSTKDATLKRNYSTDENWFRLSCKIKDNDDVLYKTNRMFAKVAENITLTIIDGIGYFAEFNDENKTITITREDGKKYEIDQIIGSDIIYGNFDFGNDQNLKLQNLWEFCKKEVPADLLIILNKHNVLLSPVENGMDSEYNDTFNAIFCDPNVGILAHEIGHVISLNNRDEKNNNNCLSKNKTLKEIYKKELEEFNKHHSSEVSKQVLGYFNETGSTKDLLLERESYYARSLKNIKRVNENTGLEEILAESMYIKTYPNAKEPIIALRTHFLMMHFPKTIGYALTLIDELYKDTLTN